MNDIILTDTIINKNRVDFKFEAHGILESYFTTNNMFIEYDISIENIPKSILNISFVSSIMPLVWLTNSVLWIDELDRTFYDCLYRLRIAYQDLYSNFPLKGKIVVAKPTDNNYKVNRQSLLLFSGGIDAHVSLLRIKETNPILCNIQGFYGDCNEKYLLSANADFKDISEFSKKNGYEFNFIKSNFAILVNNSIFNKNISPKLGDSWWHGFQHSMSFISISIPLAYINGVKNIYIASSFSLGHQGICASYATTDIEFKFATQGGCIHDAFEISRQDKVKYLVEYQKKTGKAYPVRVCSFNDTNCCECDKCFRTILEIVAENGNINNFGFNINGNLKEYWINIFKEKLYSFGISGEKRKHWPDSIKRMKENYNNIEDKEFVDWFLNYDFESARKKSLYKYYSSNFFKIIKRKLKGFFNK